MRDASLPLGSPRPAWRRALLGATSAVLAALVLAACGSAPDPLPRPSPSPSHSADHRTFHVDCSASGAGSGTAAAPWTSLDRIAQHGPFTPGDRILLRRGTTCAGRITPTGSGANGDPIVLGAYGTGRRPVVDGGGTADQTGTVQLTDVHDWTVQDLTVTNFDPAGPDDTMRAGILAVNDGASALSGIVIRHNVVKKVTSDPGSYSADPHSFGGIVVLVRAKNASATYDDVVVDQNLVDHVGRTGITTWSNSWPTKPMTNVSITRNDVQYAEGDSILLLGVDGGVVDHNRSGYGGHLPPCPRCHFTAYNTANAGIWPVNSSHVLIRYNEVYGEGDAGGDGEGFDIDEGTSDIVLEGNYAHDNDGGGVLVCGARNSDIRYNVFENDGGGEITFSCPTQREGIRIVNNVLSLPVASTGQVVRHTNTSGKDVVLFANNIVLDRSGGGYSWPAPVTAHSNVFAGVHPAGEPADITGLSAEPGLLAPGTGGMGLDSVLGLTPGIGSVAATPGTPVYSGRITDYLGHLVDPALPNRGAFSSAQAGEQLSAPKPVVDIGAAAVELSWSNDGASAWRVLRSTDGGAFVPISGLLALPVFVDHDPPTLHGRYRIVAVGRSAQQAGAPSAAGIGATSSPHG